MHLRKATISDCADIAILDNMAGRDLPLWLWQGAVMRGKADNALDWGQSRYKGQNGKAIWPEMVMAESGDEVTGMVWAYEMTDKNFATGIDDPVLKAIEVLRKQAIGHYYIDAIAVYQQFRGQGIAKNLMRHAYAQAGDKTISLIAADDNIGAIKLYHSEGFQEVASEPCIPISHHMKTKNWLLLTRH